MSEPKPSSKYGDAERDNPKQEKYDEVKQTDVKTIEAVFLGACVVDMISYADRFPAPGETLTGNDFVMCYGGKGANSVSWPLAWD
ncbi:hypothetical protein HPB49_005248 [Dermacentor silvarum]|uniref:Uncharacterized protein n=1 Tax=Dermacentor silvarum TaxID=543639 RepID=A0ACB8C288_DERSI|nr:hypothetical protein HPB49_005248 [Dermacentor silvarum]